tara:strand:+ start:1071 stop:1877 length:807 start_codon:yes stop_codon:yes gene_type:complete
MNYICFTNNQIIAKAFDYLSSIDTIFVDLEIIGKEIRQGHTNSLISRHSLEDIIKLRNVISNKALGVRINPINENSRIEIENCIDRGADVLMLPMFDSELEINKILEIVNNRCEIDLLIETPKSLYSCKDFDYSDIRKIHFGLNDLSLAFKFRHIFYCYFNNILEQPTSYLFSKNISFGLGGVGAIGSMPIAPKYILAANILYKSNRLILSRSFLNQIDTTTQDSANVSAMNNLECLNSIYNELKTLSSFEINSICDQFLYLLNKNFN